MMNKKTTEIINVSISKLMIYKVRFKSMYY